MSYNGYEVKRVHAGDFLQGIEVGGFTDASTGIHIPGPRVILNDDRQVVRIASMPDPVQLPAFKMVDRIDRDGKLYREKVAFDYNDPTGRNPSLIDALSLALSVGLIRVVPESEMRERYPHVLANADSESLFERGESKPVDMSVLIGQYHARKDAEKDAEAEALGKLHGADKTHERAAK